MKTCIQCQQTKSFVDFYKSGKGYKSKCKACLSANQKARYQDDPEFAERYKSSARKWNAENPDLHRQNFDRWREENPVRHREIRVAVVHNYRARKCRTGGTFTRDEWSKIKEDQSFRCLSCKRQEPEIRLTVDHIIPLSKGGTNNIGNIQGLCGSCNSRKNAKLIA